MNHNRRIILYSMVLIGLVSFPMIILTNLNIGSIINNNDSFIENRDHITLKTSNIIYNLTIDDLPSSTNNWSWAKSQNYCYGYGNSTDPYIIENKTFMTLTGNCLKVYNSKVNFIIRNCTFKNSGSYSSGILLQNVSNGLILNNTIKENYNGIWFDFSKDNKIINNTILNNTEYGFKFYYSHNNTIIHNNITLNNYGINIEKSNDCSISNNTFTLNSDYGIIFSHSINISILNNQFYGNTRSAIENRGTSSIISGNKMWNSGISFSTNFVDILNSNNEIHLNNTVNGKSVYFYQNKTDLKNVNFTKNGMPGQIILINCTNTEIKDLTFSNTSHGIALYHSDNSLIKNNTIFNMNINGINLYQSENASIIENFIVDCDTGGIALDGSSHFSNISKNVINNCSGSGISISYSNNLVINNNTLKFNIKGIRIYEVINLNLTNNNASKNNYGISATYAQTCIITDNICNNNSLDGFSFVCDEMILSNNTANYNQDFAFRFYLCDNCTISDNTLKGNKNTGMNMADCTNLIFERNNLTNCGFNIWCAPSLCSSIDIYTSNKVNGKPVYYYSDKMNLSHSNFSKDGDPGQILLGNCSYSKIDGFTITDCTIGISLINSNNNTISNNTISNNFYSGIYLLNSQSNNITGNSISNNMNCGIHLYFQSDYNNISDNTIEKNKYGLNITYYSINNSISNNTISNNFYTGIFLLTSQSNSITGNSISNNMNCGIHLYLQSDYNNISDNTIEKHEYGVNITSNSNNNTIAFNTFIDNTIHYYINNLTTGNNLYNNTFITNELEENPDDNPDNNPDNNDEIMIVIIIVSVTVASTAGVSSIIIYKVQKSTKNNIKITKKVGSKAIKSTKKPKIKKKTGKKKLIKKLKPSLKSSKEILKELRSKDKLLKLLEEGAKASDYGLTLISDNLLSSIDKISFTEIQKKEFLREMLAFPPLERADIVTGMLEGATFGVVVPAIPKKEKKVELEHVLVHEEKTLDLIQTYIEKHKKFEINEIIPFLISRFARASININMNGIKEIIKSLIEKNLIVEGSILVKNNILNNNNRRMIFEYIQDKPGIHLNKLAKKLDLSSAVIRWHVEILEKFNCIRKEIIGNHNAFFDLAKNPANDQLIHFISREKIKKIIQYMELNNEGCLLTKISKELGMHYNTVKNYIQKLEDFDLVFHKKERIYYINKKNLNKIKN